jgi:hypothetical protein
VFPCSRQDDAVGGIGKANIAHVVGFQAGVAQAQRGGTRQALVKKQH